MTDVALTPSGEVVIYDGEPWPAPGARELLRLSQEDAYALYRLLGAVQNQPGWTGPTGWGHKPKRQPEENS